MKEIALEIKNLEEEKKELTEQAETYISTKNWAAKKAEEVQSLQMRLADANIILDRNNQELEAEDINYEYEMISAENQNQAESLARIFEERKTSEEELRKVEEQINVEMHQTQHLLAGMCPSEKQKFLDQQAEFTRITTETEAIEVGILECEKQEARLEHDLRHDLERLELVGVYKEISRLKEKQRVFETDQKRKLSPEDEKDKLIKQFKSDNESIQRMERQMQFVEDRINKLGEELIQIEADMDQSRLTKLKSLKDTEVKFQRFLENSPKISEDEEIRLANKGAEIEKILMEIAQISDYLADFNNLQQPDMQEAQEELSGKSRELESTNNTIDLLKTDQRELEKQIQKFSKMENKLKLEALNLKKGIEIMTNQMKEFGNLDFFKSEEERRTNDLEAAKIVLSDEISELKMINSEIGRQIFHNERELSNSPDHDAITNLEKRWINLEQGNQAIIEYVQSKDTNCHGLQAMGGVSK